VCRCGRPARTWRCSPQSWPERDLRDRHDRPDRPPDIRRQPHARSGARIGLAPPSAGSWQPGSRRCAGRGSGARRGPSSTPGTTCSSTSPRAVPWRATPVGAHSFSAAGTSLRPLRVSRRASDRAISLMAPAAAGDDRDQAPASGAARRDISRPRSEESETSWRTIPLVPARVRRSGTAMRCPCGRWLAENGRPPLVRRCRCWRADMSAPAPR
jgi:hypothetical protein